MFAVILKSSGGLDMVLALELWLAEDRTAEIMIPTCVVSHRRRQLTGINPGKSMVRDPGLVMRGTGWMIAHQLTGGDVPARYYSLEMRLQGRPRLVRTRLGLQIAYWLISASPLLAFIY